MGLAETRSIEEFKTSEFYTDFKSKLKELLGDSVDIVVEWDQLAEEGEAQNYAVGFPKTYFEPILLGLSEIAIDDIGKQALQDAVKTIVVKNKTPRSTSQCATFVDGTLTYEQSLGNYNDVADRAKVVRSAVESAL